MRVTHIIPGIDPADGGPTAALMGLATAQVRAGLQVQVIACWVGSSPPPTIDTLQQVGVQVHTIGPCWGKLRWHTDTIRILTGQLPQTDIMHIHGLWENIHHQAARLSRKYRKPYIFRPCGMLDPWSLAQHSLRKKMYLALRLRHHLNRAVAMHYTADLERDLAAPLQLKAPAMVVPNGISLHEFEKLPPKGFLRQRHAAIGDLPVVLFLSRVHPKKGLDLLIPAFSRMQNQQAVFAIAGPGEPQYVDALMQTVRSLNLTDRVIFTGPLYGADRIAAMVDADLFVLPSHQENFGIVVVEALAAGTPVIISDQVNIHREITHAQVGGVVPLDISRIAHEIDRWLGDDKLRQSAAAKARPFATGHYDWNQIARQWAGHYQTLTASV